MGNIAWFTLGINERNPPKPVNLDDEFRKRGLSEEEIQELWKNMDKKLEKRKRSFWNFFKLF